MLTLTLYLTLTLTITDPSDTLHVPFRLQVSKTWRACSGVSGLGAAQPQAVFVIICSYQTADLGTQNSYWSSDTQISNHIVSVNWNCNWKFTFTFELVIKLVIIFTTKMMIKLYTNFVPNNYASTRTGMGRLIVVLIAQR